MKSKNKLWMPIFIVVIMISSTLGFMYGGSSDSNIFKYGDYTFTNTNEGWVFFVNGDKYIFNYSPKELEHRQYDIDITNLYLTYYPNDINNNIAYSIDLISQISDSETIACFERDNCITEEIVNCNEDKNILVFLTGNENLYKEDSCTFISKDIVKISEKLAYEMLGVM